MSSFPIGGKHADYLLYSNTLSSLNTIQSLSDFHSHPLPFRAKLINKLPYLTFCTPSLAFLSSTHCCPLKFFFITVTNNLHCETHGVLFPYVGLEFDPPSFLLSLDPLSHFASNFRVFFFFLPTSSFFLLRLFQSSK